MACEARDHVLELAKRRHRLKIGEPEDFEEFLRSRIFHRTARKLRAARDADEFLVEQTADEVRRIHAADLVDVFFQNRLLVRDDRERFHRAARKALRLGLGKLARERRAARLRAELVAAGDFDELDAVMRALVAIHELGDRFLENGVREVRAEKLAEFFDRNRLVGHEQKRFDAGLDFGEVQIFLSSEARPEARDRFFSACSASSCSCF